MPPVLKIDRLDVVYHTAEGPLKALHDVSFDVQPGEIIGVVGESGCGKSTVSSALLRLLPPNGEITAGQILFKGRDLRACGAEELREMRGKDLAMVFQDPMTSLNPVFTIAEQMVDVQRAHLRERASSGELRRRAIEILAKAGVPDPAERIDHYPHQFSGGLRQRILIAMALLSRPALLIADEPTSALDVTMEAQILEMIKDLRASSNTSVLFISHDLGVIAQLCDRVVVMYAGRVVEQGDIYSLYRNPLHPYTRALLASVPSRLQHGKRLATIPGRVPSLSSLPAGCKFGDRCRYAQPICHQGEPVALAVEDRQVRCLAYAPGSELRLDGPGGRQEAASPAASDHHPPSEETLLRLEGLSTHFQEGRSLVETIAGQPQRKIRAVENVNLEIRRGEVIGLVGESGCGKTTLGKTLLGLIPASAGKITFASRDTASLSPAEMRKLRARMQMIFQDPISSLSPRLKLSYLLTEPYRIHPVPKDERYNAAQLLEMVGLSDEQRDKFPHQVSGGQARRVGIARALALHPEFIVADEPTSGLDVSVAASIINLMKDLASEFNLTYLIISHNLNVVGYISDRTAVMYLGQLVEVGPTRALFESPAHPYTMALLSSISEPDPTLRARGKRLILQGETPSPRNPPSGCRFHTRCPFVTATCRKELQALQEIEPGRQAACHRWAYARQTGWAYSEAPQGGTA